MQGKVRNLFLHSSYWRQDWKHEGFEHADTENVLLHVLTLGVCFVGSNSVGRLKIRRINLQNVILLYDSVSKGQSIHTYIYIYICPVACHLANQILILGKTEHSFILCRGGLAERLCRLQNRERSAISFWRHQCLSDDKIPTGKKHNPIPLWKHYTYMYLWPI